MAVETVTAPAKLTLSLRVTGQRDGYHLIDAEMVTVDLYDTLEIDDQRINDGSDHEKSGQAEAAVVEVTHNPSSMLNVTDDLVVRALQLVGRPARVRINKQIPIGAGLGGGSADAAAVLRWARYSDPVGASAIGADVAFCLTGGRARVTGIGEIIKPMPFRREVFTLLTPPFGCSTKEVYLMWDTLGGPTGNHGNDLEPAAMAVAPELKMWRNQLAESTGRVPRLAGSGSTLFVSGAFPGPGRVIVTTVPGT